MPPPRRSIARFVEQASGSGGTLDPLTDAHLRRSLAVPYACSPALRARWDAADLGPSQERARAAARLLVDARAGEGARRGDGPARRHRHRPAAGLGRWSWRPERQRRRRRGASTSPSGSSTCSPTACSSRSPDGSTTPTTRSAGARPSSRRRCPSGRRPPSPFGCSARWRSTTTASATDAPELHRTRVRELLSLLVVERTVSRDRAIDLLWPDLDPTKGRANLRVTLGHLQRLLEPERSQGAATYFVRGDVQQLQLADVPGLEVDAWAVEAALAGAEAHRRQGDAVGRIEHLRTAVADWRGRPLADLDRVSELDHVARAVEARLIDAALTLGELELVGGASATAAALAEQVAGRRPLPRAGPPPGDRLPPAGPRPAGHGGRRRPPRAACSTSSAPTPTPRPRSSCATPPSGSAPST